MSESNINLTSQLNLSEIEIDNYGVKSVFKQFSQKENIFSGFSKVNVFIGKNNSGKSRFIRTLASEKFKRVEFSEHRFTDFNKIVEKVITESKFILNSQSLSSAFKRNISAETINIKFTPEKYVGFNIDFIKHFRKVAEDIQKLNTENDGVKKLHELNEILIGYEKVIGKENSFHKCYIPVLRGSHPLAGEERKGGQVI